VVPEHVLGVDLELQGHVLDGLEQHFLAEEQADHRLLLAQGDVPRHVVLGADHPGETQIGGGGVIAGDIVEGEEDGHRQSQYHPYRDQAPLLQPEDVEKGRG
jgi:hypothetical protein